MRIARFIFAGLFTSIAYGAIDISPATRVAAAEHDHPPITRGATQSTAVDPAVAWTAALNDPDPALREEAAKMLLKDGRASLAALGRAAKSNVPEIRLQTRRLLTQIPWDLQDDPYSIRWLIGSYGAQDVERRHSFVARLAEMRGNDAPAAWGAIERIFANDPDDSVQCQIACIVCRQLLLSKPGTSQRKPE